MALARRLVWGLCLVVLLACAGSESDGSGAAAGAGNSAAGRSGAGPAGASAAGDGSGGRAVGAAGAAGSSAGTGGAGRSTAGRGSSGAGAGGGAALDCRSLGAGCIALCEGGNCSCACTEAVPCPSEKPEAGAACESSTELCLFEERTSCRSLWQCHQQRWVMLERGACLGSDDALCPATAAEYMASAVCPPANCLYEGGIVCSCATPACSGIPREPEPVCSAAVPAVCRAGLTAGAACAPLGMRCGTTCCGIGWECTEAGWKSTNYPCPP